MTPAIGIIPTFGNVTIEQFKTDILPLKNKLYRFAFSYVSNHAEAQDVVQEVMISTWQEIKRNRTITNIEGWCMTLTKNKSLDIIRKKGRNSVAIEDQTDLETNLDSPLEEVSRKEKKVIVHNAISRLPDLQKQVINLRDIEGYSYKEIANELEIKLNHVKVLVFRGRQALKEDLERSFGHKSYQAN